MDNLRRRRVLKPKSILLLLTALSLPIVMLKQQVRMLYTLTNHTQLELDNTIDSEYQLETTTEYILEEDQQPAKKQSSRVNAYHLPFKKIFRKRKVVGDVSSMLDFAILGFPKCGTSTMRMYLNNSEIWVADKEQCQMAHPRAQGGTPELVRYLYKQSPRGDIKRGLKCPLALEAIPHLASMEKYFNYTNMIVGIRHPVRWFESFYNFRVQNMKFDKPMSPVQDCLKPNKTNNCYSLHPNRGKFHYHLSRLGKTSIEDDRRTFHKKSPKRFSHGGKVFIYVLDQLGDKNETRNGEFREDLARFLGVKELPRDIGHKHPGKERTADEQATLDKLKIDICDDGYKNVRNMLMEYARGARKWITSYFINSEDVFVSSRYYFEQLLDEWKYDPCDSS